MGMPWTKAGSLQLLLLHTASVLGEGADCELLLQGQHSATLVELVEAVGCPLNSLQVKKFPQADAPCGPDPMPLRIASAWDHEPVELVVQCWLILRRHLPRDSFAPQSPLRAL